MLGVADDEHHGQVRDDAEDLAMHHGRLGRAGLRVGRLALGCMSYGDPRAGSHSWAPAGDTSQPLFGQAVELGVTFWDTANTY